MKHEIGKPCLTQADGKTILLLRSQTAFYGKNDNDKPLFNSNANKKPTDPGNHSYNWRLPSKKMQL